MALALLKEAESQQEQIQRFPVEIEGERAWLIVKDGLLASINWENGKKITLIDEKIDFMKAEQLDEGSKTLYSLCKDILDDIEKKGISPVFTVPREYGGELLKDGLVPRATWMKDTKLLASTIGIPYYNKSGDRLLCIPNGSSFEELQLRPRLTGKHPAIFQGVVATESSIPANKLIIIDSVDYKVINNSNDVLRPVEMLNIEGVRNDVQANIDRL